MFESRIARRYWLMLAGSIAVSAIVFGLVQGALVFRGARVDATRLQASELRAVMARLDAGLEEVTAGLRRVCRMPWSSPLATVEDQRTELRRFLNSTPAVVEVQGISGAGLETAFVSRVHLDRTDSRQRVEVPAMDGTGRGFGPVFFSEGLAPHVRVTCREAGVSNGAAIVAEMNLEFLSELVGESGRRLQGEAFLVDDRGKLIAHSRPVAVFSAGDAASLGFTGAPVSSKGEVTSNWTGGLTDGRLASFAALETAPWRLGVAQPVRVVLAPALFSVAATVAIAIVLAALSSVVAMALASHLSKPVTRLRTAVRAAADANFAQRIELKTGDELEDLARDFNTMANQLEEYTRGLERKVADAMRTRAVFLAAASHDLRQPLYAISILADTLSIVDLPPGGRAVLDKQRQAIAVLRSLFDNLLDLSRLEAGEIRPVSRLVSIREVLESVAAEYEVLCDSKGVGWTSTVEDAWVDTDAQLLRRMVGNLLSNAVRYTSAGGAVSLAATTRDQAIVITVSDSGIGIAPADHERIFEEFVQLGNPSRDREKGVGLGLSIVRRISELLGIRLRLDSAPGEGTTVSFEMPVVQAAAEVDPHRPGAETPVPHAALAGMRVWIVEDDELVRGALSIQCSAWGVRCDFARNRAEVAGLRAKHGAWPDAVVLDEMLESGEHGLDIARWLLHDLPADRIVFVTGTVDRSRLQAIRDAGFDVLAKPLSTALLARWLAQQGPTLSTVASPTE